MLSHTPMSFYNFVRARRHLLSSFPQFSFLLHFVFPLFPPEAGTITQTIRLKLLKATKFQFLIVSDLIENKLASYAVESPSDRLFVRLVADQFPKMEELGRVTDGLTNQPAGQSGNEPTDRPNGKATQMVVCVWTKRRTNRKCFSNDSVSYRQSNFRNSVCD